jgi:hypothetical protein
MVAMLLPEKRPYWFVVPEGLLEAFCDWPPVGEDLGDYAWNRAFAGREDDLCVMGYAFRRHMVREYHRQYLIKAPFFS